MDTDYPRAKPQVGIDENIVKRKNKGKKDDLVMSILQNSV